MNQKSENAPASSMLRSTSTILHIGWLGWKYLWFTPWTTALHIAVVALGTGLLALLLLAGQGLSEGMEKQSRIADLVVGAKGSPLQLVLCAVFHADLPTGNISLAEADKLAGSPMVAQAVPLALGDSHQGFRVVGTTPKFLTLYQITQPATGTLALEHGQALVGSAVAKKLNIGLGYRFHSEHGLEVAGDEHSEHGYEVVGILPPTGTAADQLWLVDIPSVWEAHHLASDSITETSIGKLGLPLREGAEITSLLLKFNNPMGVLRFLPYINQQTQMQAASPSFEAYRLLALVETALEVGKLLALLMVAVAFLSMGLSLYHALQERRYDLAIMRAMGASRGKVAALLLFEGGTQALLGSLFGIGLAALAWLVIAANFQLSANMVASTQGLLGLCGLVTLAGLLTALLPAVQAYRTAVSDTLAMG